MSRTTIITLIPILAVLLPVEAVTAAALVSDPAVGATQAVSESLQGGSGGLDALGLVAVLAAPLMLGVFIWRRWYRLEDAPPRPKPFSPAVGLLLFCGMLLAGWIGAGIAMTVLFADAIAEHAASVTMPDAVKLQAAGFAGQAILLSVFAWLCHRAARPLTGVQYGSGRAVLIGAGSLILLWPLVMCAASGAALIVKYLFDVPVDLIAHDTLWLFVESPVDGWMFAMAGMVVIAVPVVEEVTYRGILQHTLVRAGLGRWLAILATSAVFASMHFDVAQWHAVVAIFVLSLGFGWVYEKTGRLAAAVTMHALFNAVNLAQAMLWAPA